MKIQVQRRRDALREGVLLKGEDGLKFYIMPNWSHIAEDLALVGPDGETTRTELKEAIGAFLPEDADAPNLFTSDPRILLQALRFLLDGTGEEEFNLRRLVDDEEEARSSYDELSDRYGHIILARWRDVL